MKNKIKSIIPLILILFFFCAYGGGIGYQYLNKNSIGTNEWTPQSKEISFDIFECLKIGISPNEGLKYSILAIAIISFIIIILSINGNTKAKRIDERGFVASDKGTYGTSGWMTPEEVKQNFDLKPVTQTDGTILGEYQGQVISTPVKSRLNKHVAVYGASGTGKSRCFVRSHIIQCVHRGESVIVTDPKGELYADTAQFLRDNGYNVKVFNLVSLQYSDSWACLDEITATEDEIELMAQTFCDVIIKNTMEGAKGDHFWDNAEMNLLKALCLYVVMADENTIPSSGKTIGAVYELLTSQTEDKLTAMFDCLPIAHPARKPWTIFKQASESVRGNVIIGLGSRIQVFQTENIKKITSMPDIDLEAPAKEKCGYFVIMSDQNSTLDFLSSLFFSFLFIRLVKYADVHGKNGACDVPVNFILDEFPNIGQIPDFTKKLSTIRSRELRVVVIFQNVAQLQNRYPNGLWEEIIGNCDTQLFLGCTDQMTAEFVSKRSGEMSIEVNSNSVKKDSMAILQSIPSFQESTSVGKRAVLTPDEVLRLPSNNALIILRGQKIVKIDKYDFSKHPVSSQFKYVPVRDHIPKWRQPMIDAEKNPPPPVIKTPVDINDLDDGFSVSAPSNVVKTDAVPISSNNSATNNNNENNNDTKTNPEIANKTIGNPGQTESVGETDSLLNTPPPQPNKVNKTNHSGVISIGENQNQQHSVSKYERTGGPKYKKILQINSKNIDACLPPNDF